VERDIALPRGGSHTAAPGPGEQGVTRRPAGAGELNGQADASIAVTSLYRAHALGLTRLAFIILGDRQAAEDVVQEAFCGLFRAWNRLPDHSRVQGYLRVSVVNGCRSAMRRARHVPRALAVPDAPSAEADALVGEEQRAAVAALRRLPPRQREALVLRYYADLPEQETALAMGVSRGTVKSTTARALATLARMLREDQ
jgi:RNA polymerase sigma-70 factor (sigma-E family)